MGRNSEGKFNWVGPFLARFFMLAIVIGIVGLFLGTFYGEDLSSLDGRVKSVKDRPVANVLRMIDQAVEERRVIELNEEQVNLFLKKNLIVQQRGPISNFGVNAKGVWVRFHDGRMEVIIERSVFGNPHTLSIFLTFDKELDDFGKETLVMRRVGGKFGRMKVAPGFVHIVQPGFDKIVNAMEDKLLKVVGEMNAIEFRPGKVVLDPTLNVPPLQ